MREYAREETRAETADESVLHEGKEKDVPKVQRGVDRARHDEARERRAEAGKVRVDARAHASGDEVRGGEGEGKADEEGEEAEEEPSRVGTGKGLGEGGEAGGDVSASGSVTTLRGGGGWDGTGRAGGSRGERTKRRANEGGLLAAGGSRASSWSSGTRDDAWRDAGGSRACGRADGGGGATAVGCGARG